MLAGVVLALRHSTAEERKTTLRGKKAEDLRAICVGLRIPQGGSSVDIADRICTTLGADDSQVDFVRSLARVMGKLLGTPAAAEMLTQRTKVDDLKDICRRLRLPTSGPKAAMSQRIIQEITDRSGATFEALKEALPEPPVFGNRVVIPEESDQLVPCEDRRSEPAEPPSATTGSETAVQQAPEEPRHSPAEALLEGAAEAEDLRGNFLPDFLVATKVHERDASAAESHARRRMHFAQLVREEVGSALAGVSSPA